MYEIVKSDTFCRWLKKLKDRSAKYKILVRLKKIEEGHLENYRRIDRMISELKFDFGPCYKIYFSEERKGPDPVVRRRQRETKAGYKQSP